MRPLNALHLVTVFFLPSIGSHCQQCDVLGTRKGYIHDTSVQCRYLQYFCRVGYQKASVEARQVRIWVLVNLPLRVYHSPALWWSGFVLSYQTVNDSGWAVGSMFPSSSAQAPHLSAEGGQWAAKQGLTLQDVDQTLASRLLACKTWGYQCSPAFSEPAWTLTGTASCLLQQNWWHLAENASHVCSHPVHTNLSLYPFTPAKTQNHRFSAG